MTEHAVFPVWVFRRGAEAGGDATLWCNNFGRPRLTRGQRIEMNSMLNRLRREIRAGRLPPGRTAVGWGGVSGVQPPHAADTTDPAAMRLWFARAFVVVLSCDEMAERADDDERVGP